MVVLSIKKRRIPRQISNMWDHRTTEGLKIRYSTTQVRLVKRGRDKQVVIPLINNEETGATPMFLITHLCCIALGSGLYPEGKTFTVGSIIAKTANVFPLENFAAYGMSLIDTRIFNSNCKSEALLNVIKLC